MKRLGSPERACWSGAFYLQNPALQAFWKMRPCKTKAEMYATILQQTHLDLYSTPKRWLVIVFSTIACSAYVGTNGGWRFSTPCKPWFVTSTILNACCCTAMSTTPISGAATNTAWCSMSIHVFLPASLQHTLCRAATNAPLVKTCSNISISSNLAWKFSVHLSVSNLFSFSSLKKRPPRNLQQRSPHICPVAIQTSVLSTMIQFLY